MVYAVVGLGAQPSGKSLSKTVMCGLLSVLGVVAVIGMATNRAPGGSDAAGTQMAGSSTGPLFFKAELAADQTAVPLIHTGAKGQVFFALAPDTDVMKMAVAWVGAGEAPYSSSIITPKNILIGIHIHVGNSTTNGPILLGFCGSSPLPAFGVPAGPCNQTSEAQFHQYTASACNINADVCFYDYDSAAAKSTTAAAAFIRSSKPPQETLYVNIHTTDSYNLNHDVPLGLIRGQLHHVDKAAVPLHLIHEIAPGAPTKVSDIHSGATMMFYSSFVMLTPLLALHSLM